jgi:SAM-dependent methyltransferase
VNIAAINQEHVDFRDGLQDISLTRLNRIVILAGPNGSGKTRLIGRIGSMNGTSVNAQLLDACKRTFFDTLPGGGIRLKDDADLGRTISNSAGLTRPSCIHVDFAEVHDSEKIVVASLVTGDLGLQDCEDLAPSHLIKCAEDAKSPGIGNIPKGCLAHIRLSQQKWWDSTHPNSTVDQQTRTNDAASYMALCELIRIVLGTELKRNGVGQPEMFDKPIAKAGLSNGQVVLLQWIVCLHAQDIGLRDIIVTLDEPENHLHPEAMIQTIFRIVEANENGQMWIATHSVGLIAALWHRYPHDISLFCMNNGVPSYAGRDPENVLISLIGGDENIQAIREFLDLPGVLAANRFAAECLSSPLVIASTERVDPQITLIQSTIVPVQGSIKVLDFGSGKGRLLGGLLNQYRESTKDRVNYVAWDHIAIEKHACLNMIASVFPDPENRWFQDSGSMARCHHDKSFDFVVMCNVLHEIDPKDWISLFGDTSIIRRCLMDSGKLLIVEDYLMPQGEYAHPYGFIVLDTEALKALFVCDLPEIQSIEAEGKYAGRIRAHLIQKRVLARVTTESRKAALARANATAREQIRKIRSTSVHNFKSGQEHAFWVQQFANSALANNDL